MFFARHLADELTRIGLTEVQVDENGYLTATLPANTSENIPVVGFIAHVDTSPDFTGKHVNPRMVKKYNGVILFWTRNQVCVKA
jgi:tripeptide aminopeptidase